jgi:hypothetical protein
MVNQGLKVRSILERAFSPSVSGENNTRGSGLQPRLVQISFLNELIWTAAAKPKTSVMLKITPLRPLNAILSSYGSRYSHWANLDSIFALRKPQFAKNFGFLYFQWFNSSKMPVSELIWTALGFSPDPQ